VAKVKPPAKDVKRQEALANRPVQFTALSDQPLLQEECCGDRFNLVYQLGPVYDILRNPDTRPPLAIALYGDWGSGKTTAMRWLDDLLEKGSRTNAVHVRTIWFYPWKYHDREDVWRGLVAEVILNSLDARNADVHTVIKAARQFGRFLGRSFVHVLSAYVPPAGAAAKDVLAEWQAADHPESAYLNDFETTLKDWVKDTLGKQGRMVVFIDDLDRCMPDVAVQVLEALKLYLDVEKLIFVVGLDRAVIEQQILKRYAELGVDKEKAAKYLNKMFQVEVTLAPRIRHVEAFLDAQIEAFRFWKDNLEDDHQQIFRDVVLNLSQGNPREIKRLLNSAAMYGAGYLMSEEENSAPHADKLKFAQALLYFFCHRIAAERYGLDKTPRDRQLLDAVLRNPEELHQGRFKAFDQNQEKQFIAFVLDPNLKHLLQIPYPKEEEIKILAAAMPEPEVRGTLLDRITKALGKKPEEATQDDYDKVKELDLSGLPASNLSILSRFTNLQLLNLNNTQVSDLSPLEGLANLLSLEINDAPISDLSLLKRLTNLQVLDLSNTQVSDLSPLKGLTNLLGLYLSNTQVSDLSPLKGLANLQVLYLYNTPGSDPSPLKGLANLQTLVLSDTPVSDLSPLKGLANLQTLFLSGTPVSDLSPLKGLANLRGLNLDRTPVFDLSPLKGLANLQILYLSNTPVSDLLPLKGLAKLQGLSLSNTRVSDLSPLKGLAKLEWLSFQDTPAKRAGVKWPLE